MVDAGLLVARVLLASFFVVEGIDKIRRFDAWTQVVAEAGMPAPAAEMALVVFLLVIGSLSVLLGLRVPVGVTCLIVFAVPTALFFESSAGAWKLVAIMGGLLLLAMSGPGAYSVDRLVEPAVTLPPR